MMKKVLTALILLTGFQALRAQDMIFTLDYNFGKATGDMEEFVSDNAYRGGGLKYTKFLDGAENLGIGMSIDWQGFYRKMPRSTFPYYDPGTNTTTMDMNAVQFRYMYMAPIYLSLNYYPIKDAPFLPYIAINAGVIYTEQELYISAFDNEINTSWDFGFGPEAGLHLSFGESGLGLNVQAKYNLSLYNHTFSNINFETGQGSHLSLGVGLSFMMMNYY